MLTVAVLNLFLPLIAAAAILVDPIACMIPEDQPEPPEEEAALFRSVSRNMASGSLLSVGVAYFAVTTKDISKLRMAVVLQLLYMLSLVLNMALAASDEGVELDVNLVLLTALSIVLHAYIYVKIRFHDDSSEPLLDEGSREEIVAEYPRDSEIL